LLGNTFAKLEGITAYKSKNIVNKGEIKDIVVSLDIKFKTVEKLLSIVKMTKENLKKNG